MSDINSFKEKIDKILNDAIETNKEQIIGGAADDFPTYKYLVGVGQTLSDMKSRFHDEYIKLFKTGEGEWSCNMMKIYQFPQVLEYY